MTLGRIVFDGMLSLDITSMALRDGLIVFKARGEVANGVPVGVVPHVLYGADGSLVAVGRVDFDQLMAGRPPLRTGDALDLTWTLDVQCMGTTSVNPHRKEST